ncbi:hypothetical protein EOD39_11698 [Acipenser ruthenus]|uniref:PiggyBac transposable element-derived protein domain-containing protein n=1 Tax=Acipenser ruthenus TaxID=7906 RepID=A0A662YRL0_ACIRT|nr:hypothetical protein EOD39_11698 [Acipenser ruthenus]
MGGVDKMDHLIALYRQTTQQKRWYMQIFYHFLNLAVVNTWIIHKWNASIKPLDLLHFKASIAHSLINMGNVEKRTRGCPSENITTPNKEKSTREVRYHEVGTRWPEKTDKKNRWHDACKKIPGSDVGNAEYPSA